jgi:GPH family glycoside/pentoside/hexuronide:cation symporter
MTQKNPMNNFQPQRDRIPVLTKISYGLGTGLDMWGFWLYPGVAFAVFNMYLGVVSDSGRAGADSDSPV